MNKPMKEELRRIHKWFSSEAEKQRKDVSFEQAKVNVGMSNIKGRSASWKIAAWQAIATSPEIAINVLKKSGIVGAIESV